MENEFLKLIESRRSIRKYLSKQITDEELEAVTRAGTYAPSGMGAQAGFIVAVQEKELRDKISKMNAAVGGFTSDPFYGAPTIVLVFAPKDRPISIQDGTCILTTMMLAAKAVGLGSCWINREIEMFASEEGKKMMRDFGLPEGLMGIGALALGYAAAPPSPLKPRKEGYVRVVK
jgi:nitroreductase